MEEHIFDYRAFQVNYFFLSHCLLFPILLFLICPGLFLAYKLCVYCANYDTLAILYLLLSYT